TVINRIIRNPPPDILDILGVVIICRTHEAELGRVVRTLTTEAPEELSILDRALQDSMIDINSIAVKVQPAVHR
ncbi:MAG: hypothetical protein JSW16_06155, partial [Dehalococcoidales bacterium]